MFKPAVTLYIIIFSVYILFSRQPDYFDGQITSGTILSGSVTNATAHFTVGNKPFTVSANYAFRQYGNHQSVQIIYETAHPERATVYAWWGYWIRWEECLMSLVLFIALYRIAVSITSNPTPEALAEEAAAQNPAKKPKYLA
jgi:hypothetical protein